jgi:hypothetical protein
MENPMHLAGGVESERTHDEKFVCRGSKSDWTFVRFWLEGCNSRRKNTDSLLARLNSSNGMQADGSPSIAAFRLGDST